MTNVSMESVLERMTVFSDAATYAFRCDVSLLFGISLRLREIARGYPSGPVVLWILSTDLMFL